MLTSCDDNNVILLSPSTDLRFVRFSSQVCDGPNRDKQELLVFFKPMIYQQVCPQTQSVYASLHVGFQR